MSRLAELLALAVTAFAAQSVPRRYIITALPLLPVQPITVAAGTALASLLTPCPALFIPLEAIRLPLVVVAVHDLFGAVLQLLIRLRLPGVLTNKFIVGPGGRTFGDVFLLNKPVPIVLAFQYLIFLFDLIFPAFAISHDDKSFFLWYNFHMNEDFERWRAHIDYVVARSKRPGTRRAADALADCWEKLEREGVEAYDFARVALLMAESAMRNFDCIEEAYHFGKSMAVEGEELMSACRPHLPPEKL